MTGPEGQGGDDQDLDDKVIQHLSEENRRLKEELELVKDGHEVGAAEGKLIPSLSVWPDFAKFAIGAKF